MARRKALPDFDTRLTDAKATIRKDIDRLQIIIESINREGGFAQLTEHWPREDVRLFCQAMIDFGAMLTRSGQQLIHALNRS
jgi:hypothetical protein